MLDCSKIRVEKAEVYSFCGNRGKERHFCVRISGVQGLPRRGGKSYTMEVLLEPTVLERELKAYIKAERVLSHLLPASSIMLILNELLLKPVVSFRLH